MISQYEVLGRAAKASPPGSPKLRSASHGSLSSSTEVNAQSTPSPAVPFGDTDSPVDCSYCDEQRCQPSRSQTLHDKASLVDILPSETSEVIVAQTECVQLSPDEEEEEEEEGTNRYTLEGTSRRFPSPNGLLCSGEADSSQSRFFKPRQSASTGNNHYRDSSVNSCMTERVNKVVDEGQESPATHTVAPQAVQTIEPWPPAWKTLLRFQAVTVILLFIATLMGATFAGIKWSYVSPKLHAVSISTLKDAIFSSNISRPDYQFAKSVLFTPINSLTEPQWHVLGDDVYEMSEDLSIAPFSVFIPSSEKREFRKHRQEDASYPPKFSTALICSELSHDITDTDYVWSYAAFSSPKPDHFNAEMGQLFSPTSPSKSLLMPHMAKYDASVLGLGRRCVLWSDGTSMLKSMDIPRIIKGTRGLFTPNYPGGEWIHDLLQNPLWMSLIILFAWSHSLFTEQSWTGVHLPRLTFYAAVGLYRWLVLYQGFGEIEKLSQIQILLRSADTAYKLSRNFSRKASDFFDFSDHMVATFTCLFVLATELFCLFEFSFRPAVPKETTSSLVSTGSTETSPPTPSITGIQGQFERPWKLPRVLLYCWSGILILVVAALIYGGFATAAFFHSPLETLIGYLVGVVGIWGVFWLLLYFDSGIHSIWFWHT